MGHPGTAVSDAAGNYGGDDDGDDQVLTGHADEMAADAGQGRAEEERDGGGDEVFHVSVLRLGFHSLGEFTRAGCGRKEEGAVTENESRLLRLALGELFRGALPRAGMRPGPWPSNLIAVVHDRPKRRRRWVDDGIHTRRNRERS